MNTPTPPKDFDLLGISISSLVVNCLPAHVEGVREALNALPGVEVHATDDQGRLIVTTETPGDDATAERFEHIRQTPGVLSASMVYHRFESEPDKEA